MTKIRLPKAKATVDEFIKGANPAAKVESHRDDAMKPVALRLPESYAAKLQWISETTEVPQQRLLRKWLLPLIDEEVARLSG